MLLTSAAATASLSLLVVTDRVEGHLVLRAHSLFVNSPHAAAAAAPTPEVLQQTTCHSCHHRITPSDSDGDTAEVPIPLRDCCASSRNPRDGRPFTSLAQLDKSISAIAVKLIYLQLYPFRRTILAHERPSNSVALLA